MNTDLLLKAADMIEDLSLGEFKTITNTRDIAAYIVAAAGKPLLGEERGPQFERAKRLADLPGDKLLWVGGWPEEFREQVNLVWKNKPEGETVDWATIATIAAYAVRAYVEDPWE